MCVYHKNSINRNSGLITRYYNVPVILWPLRASASSPAPSHDGLPSTGFSYREKYSGTFTLSLRISPAKETEDRKDMSEKDRSIYCRRKREFARAAHEEVCGEGDAVSKFGGPTRFPVETGNTRGADGLPGGQMQWRLLFNIGGAHGRTPRHISLILRSQPASQPGSSQQAVASRDGALPSRARFTYLSTH